MPAMYTVLLLLLATGCSFPGAGDPVRRERRHPRPDAATALDARLLSSAPLPRDAAQRGRPQPPSGATFPRGAVLAAVKFLLRAIA